MVQSKDFVNVAFFLIVTELKKNLLAQLRMYFHQKKTFVFLFVFTKILICILPNFIIINEHNKTFMYKVWKRHIVNFKNYILKNKIKNENNNHKWLNRSSKLILLGLKYS